jgi:hypothetical protein
MKIRENSQVERLAISSALLALLTIMVSQAIPDDVLGTAETQHKGFFKTIKLMLSPVATATGLRQDWNMFAPNPRRENIDLNAEITYRNGEQYIWSFPQMQELGYAERYAKERYRKFANDNLWLTRNSAIWPDAARFIARLNGGDRANPPVTVKLIRYWSEIPGEPGQPERWRRDVFFTYTLSPGDLL